MVMLWLLTLLLSGLSVGLPGFVHEPVDVVAVAAPLTPGDPVGPQSVDVVVEDVHHVWLHVVEADGVGAYFLPR